MNKILITGLNSYVGKSLEKWLENYPDEYVTESISLRDNRWRERNFSEFDVVFHVAGIAHVKETKENESLYYKVNRDLAYEVAKKSKNDGIRHFIFLSSMSVYGLENGVINKKTSLAPKSNYGKSKLQAEELIKELANDAFRLAIIRPPMIYGKGCKGNYTRLAKLAIKTPVFPAIKNKRSMIYIDNLSEFIRVIIDNSESGLYFPQNKEYVQTSNMVQLIAEANGKSLRTTKIFNPIFSIINSSVVNKVFGDLVYEKNLSQICNKNYSNLVDFEQSIRLTED